MFSQIQLLGVKPELMYLVTILIAILEGPQEGAIVGFAGGMVQDFLLNSPKGITALTLTLLGYTMGMARQYIVSSSPLLPAILVAVGTAAGTAFYQVGGVPAGAAGSSRSPTPSRSACSRRSTARILTPIFYPLLRRLTEGSSPTRVVRF